MSKLIIRARMAMASVAGLAIVFATATQAQDVAQDTGSDDPGTDSGEIVVTAQKRAESLQKVPVSVGVIQGEQLEIKGIDRAIDAAVQVPGVVFQQTDEARTASISIRGIGSNGVSEGFEPSVSAIIDGEVYARTTSLTQQVADVERVEVLRGPQGTLFGKNTSAGAVSVVTKKPAVGEFKGEMSLRLAEHDEQTTKGFINLPIGEKAALRINGFYQHIGGWLRNAAPGQESLSHTEAFGVRGQLRFQPNDQLDIVLRADYSKSNSNSTGTIRLSTDTTAGGQTIAAILASFGQEIGPNSLTASADETQYSNIKNKGASADIAYTVGDWEIRSQTYVRQNRLDENRDADALPINAGPKRFAGFVQADSIQQELRLTSPKWDFGDFILGGFYYHAKTARDGANQICTQLATLTPDTGGTHLTTKTYYDPVTLKVTDCQGAGVNPYNTVNDFSTAVTRDNLAVFGNMNVNVSEQFKVFAGARLLTEKTSIRFSSSQAPTTSLANPFRDSRRDDAFIMRAGAQFFATSDLNFYGSYSTGYKGPTYNDTGGSTPTTLSPGGADYLEPEHSKQIELGLRSQWFDRALTINLTAYRLRIAGFQERVSQFVDLNGDGIFDDVQGVTINAGLVESKGLEWDTSWRTPLEGLTLSYSGAYTDASYKDFGNNFLACPAALVGTGVCFDPASIPGTNEFVDPEGKPLSRAPKWQHNVAAKYNTDLSFGGSAHFEASYRWQSKFNFDIAGDPNAVQKAYGVVDLSAGYTSPSETVSVNLFIHNLFDKRYYSSILDQPAGFGGGYRAGVPRDALRYFGGSVKVRF